MDGYPDKISHLNAASIRHMVVVLIFFERGNLVTKNPKYKTIWKLRVELSKCQKPKPILNIC